MLVRHDGGLPSEHEGARRHPPEHYSWKSERSALPDHVWCRLPCPTQQRLLLVVQRDGCPTFAPVQTMEAVAAVALAQVRPGLLKALPKAEQRCCQRQVPIRLRLRS